MFPYSWPNRASPSDQVILFHGTFLFTLKICQVPKYSRLGLRGNYLVTFKAGKFKWFKVTCFYEYSHLRAFGPSALAPAQRGSITQFGIRFRKKANVQNFFRWGQNWKISKLAMEWWSFFNLKECHYLNLELVSRIGWNDLKMVSNKELPNVR